MQKVKGTITESGERDMYKRVLMNKVFFATNHTHGVLKPGRNTTHQILTSCKNLSKKKSSGSACTIEGEIIISFLN